MSEPTTETKTCDSCDAVIGKSEKTCPKCGVDFEELEDAITTVSKAQAIIEKRKKAEQPPAPPAPPEKKNPLRSLGAVLRKKTEAK